MGYIRQNYHSGLTYQQECELCHTLVRYTDRILGFRPWFPDGFIYCPKCEKPLRHSEKFAINPVTGEYLNSTSTVGDVKKSATSVSSGKIAKFCSQCGRKFEDGERFCPSCGKER